jgi:hypothetical protein
LPDPRCLRAGGRPFTDTRRGSILYKRISALLLACVVPTASADDIVRIKAQTDHLTDADSGYVLASETTFNQLYFVNVTTRQEYRSDGTYCGRLPVGRYQLYKINSPYGTVTSDAPFSFEVVAGQRRYLGTLSPQWDSDARKYAEERARNRPVRKYDLSKFMRVAYDYTAFDLLSGLGRKYQKRCKGVDISEFEVSLMQ